MTTEWKADWYREAYTLDMIGTPWTQNTTQDIEFVIQAMQLEGDKRILDVGCGYGRHSIELAQRGFRVVGIDISPELINYAINSAKSAGVSVEFIAQDIREFKTAGEFDVVLNLYDGAIGYFLDEGDNLRMFEVVAKALRLDGYHFLHIPHFNYVQQYCPRRNWSVGNEVVQLMDLSWDAERKRLHETDYHIRFGEILDALHPFHESKRVYTMDEIKRILNSLSLQIEVTYGGIGKFAPPTDEDDYLTIISKRV